MADQNALIGVAVSYDMAWQRRNGDTVQILAMEQ